jgi:hypothetical protein
MGLLLAELLIGFRTKNKPQPSSILVIILGNQTRSPYLFKGAFYVLKNPGYHLLHPTIQKQALGGR